MPDEFQALRKERCIEIIKACNGSGIPKRQWCREHGISYSTLMRWQRSLRNELAGGIMVTQAVVPLQIEPQASCCTTPVQEVTIQKDGISISIHGASRDREKREAVCDVAPELLILRYHHTENCIREEMSMARIIRNAIRCKKCGDIIESKTVHDFKVCSCGACAVDGGHDYLRRCGNLEDWEELSEAEKVENNSTLT